MAVNFGLLQPAAPVSAFFQGQQDVQAQAQQNMLRQQQAEQMAFQRENMLAQRGEREAMAQERRAATMRATERQAYLKEAADALAQGNEKLDRPTLMRVLKAGTLAEQPALIQFAQKTLTALDEEARDAAEMARIQGREPAAAAPMMAKRVPLPAAPAAPVNMLAGTPFDIGTTQPAPVNALAAPSAAAPAAAPGGGVSREQVQQMLSSSVKSVRERGEALARMLPKDVQPQTRTIDVGPEILTEEYDPVSRTTRILSRQKKALSPAEAATDLREAKRIGLETRRVTVAEENARRDADPAFQQRMANARVTGEAIAKGDVAAQRALPQVISRAEDGLRLIDEMVGKQEVRDKSGKVVQAATKPHPGFQNAVGATWLPGVRFVPGTDAAGFMSRFDQIKGASFLEAFESLKGGGAITEKEGAKATDAINRMSIATDEKEFLTAARDLQNVVRAGVENAKRKSLGGAASASPNVDALLDKYK